MSGIIYSCVARGEDVLCEHSSASGNFISIAKVILGKIRGAAEGARKSYSYERYLFHFQKQQGLTFLCMTDEGFSNLRAFGFLQDVSGRFVAQYGPAHNVRPYALNGSFSRELAKQADYFSNDPAATKLDKVRSEVDKTKTLMVESIEKVLERGERIELLVNETEKLQDQSFKFKKLGKSLKYAMCYKNIKLIILIVVVSLVALWLILSLACGFDFHKCGNN